MACSQPFSIDKIRHYHPKRLYSSWQNYVPCGWCLNCRKDKQNMLRDRCEYEYIDKKCGAFVTFTFDDINLLRFMHFDTHDNKLRASLSKRETKKFLDRLNKIVHNQPNSILCNHHYKYLVVGEYGEHGDNPALVGRPHLHILFFGLDYAFCDKLFAQAWQDMGNIYIGNIGDGAISYVLKYMDKQCFGKQAFQKYEYHGIERPFQSHSLGLGQGLYSSQHDYIIKHNYNYRWHAHDTPVPMYYKNKFYNNPVSPLALRLQSITKSINQYKNELGYKPKSMYDLKSYSHDKALIRQRNLAIKMRQSGSPVLETSNFYESTSSHRLNILPDSINTFIKNYRSHKVYRKRGRNFEDLCNFFDSQIVV